MRNELNDLKLELFYGKTTLFKFYDNITCTSIFVCSILFFFMVNVCLKTLHLGVWKCLKIMSYIKWHNHNPPVSFGYIIICGGIHKTVMPFQMAKTWGFNAKRTWLLWLFMVVCIQFPFSSETVNWRIIQNHSTCSSGLSASWREIIKRGQIGTFMPDQELSHVWNFDFNVTKSPHPCPEGINYCRGGSQKNRWEGIYWYLKDNFRHFSIKMYVVGTH